MTPKEEIFTALSSDATLLALLGSDTTKISEFYPSLDTIENEQSSFPKITYVETSRANIFFVDNTAIKDRIIYRVDIWIPPSYIVEVQLASLGREVDRVMANIGYRKTDSNDDGFSTDKIYVRTLEYVKEINSNL